MKNFLLALTIGLLMVGGVASAQTTTYTGTVKNLDGTVATSGQVVFTLQAPTSATISGVGRFTNQAIICAIQGDGTILNANSSGPCVVTSNTALSPSGTYYSVAIQAYFRTPGAMFNTYAYLSSQDISTVIPVPPSAPAYQPATGAATVPSANPVTKSNGSNLVAAVPDVDYATPASVATVSTAAAAAQATANAAAVKANNLSDLTNAVTARGSLGLGNAAVQTVPGTGLVKVASGNFATAGAGDIASTLSGQTGCSTVGYVYSPQSGTCIVAGGGSPGGTNLQLQFNNSSAFGGAKATYTVGGALDGNVTLYKGLLANRSDIVDAVADCGLPTDGVTDSTPAWNTCVSTYGGKTIVFPKVQPQGSTDFYFASTPNQIPNGTHIKGTGWSYSSTTGNPPQGTILKIASCQSGLKTAQNVEISDINIIGSDPAPRNTGDTALMILPAGSNLSPYVQVPNTLSRTGGVVTATFGSPVGPAMYKIDGIIRVSGADASFNGDFRVDSDTAPGGVETLTWLQAGTNATASVTGQVQPGTTGTCVNDGITISQPSVVISHVGVGQFSRSGIRLDTAVVSDDFSIDHVWIYGNRAHGLDVPGGNDNSAGTTEHILTYWNQLFGLADVNFLGNYHNSTQASYNHSGGINPVAGSPISITSVSRTSGVLTYQTSAAHGFSVGNAVSTFGVTDKTFNTYEITTGAVNVMAISPSPALGSYTVGTKIRFAPNLTTTNTTPAINVSGLGNITITDINGAALAVGAIANPFQYLAIYNADGTFHLQGGGAAGCWVATVPDSTHFTCNDPLAAHTNASSSGGSVRLAEQYEFFRASAIYGGCYFVGGKGYAANNVLMKPYCEGGQATDNNGYNSQVNATVHITQPHGVAPDPAWGGIVEQTGVANGYTVSAPLVGFNAGSYHFKQPATGADALTIDGPTGNLVSLGTILATQIGAGVDSTAAVYASNAAGTRKSFCTNTVNLQTIFNTPTATCTYHTTQAFQVYSADTNGDQTTATTGEDLRLNKGTSGITPNLSMVSHSGNGSWGLGGGSTFAALWVDATKDFYFQTSPFSDFNGNTLGAGGSTVFKFDHTAGQFNFGVPVQLSDTAHTGCITGTLGVVSITNPCGTPFGKNAIYDSFSGTTMSTGAADNATALSNAVAGLNGTGELRIPCGTYTFTTGVTFNNINNITLIGEGNSGRSSGCVIFNQNGPADLLTIHGPTSGTSTHGPRIENITFVDIAGNSRSAIRMDNYNDFTFKNLSASNYVGAQYSTGTVNVSNGSAAVVGTGTTWTAAMVPGVLWIAGVPQLVATFTDATHITLANQYTGSTNTTASYALDYAGMPFIFDVVSGGSASFNQYASVYDLRGVNNKYAVMLLGGPTSAGGNSRINFYGGDIQCNRIPDGSALYVGPFNDTINWQVASNNCAIHAVIEHAHANKFQNFTFEDTGTPTINQTCVAAQIPTTSWAIAANVATFQATNTLSVGNTVSFNGFATGSFFNGIVTTVTAATGTQFSIAFTHANTSATETGNAALALKSCVFGAYVQGSGSNTADNKFVGGDIINTGTGINIGTNATRTQIIGVGFNGLNGSSNSTNIGLPASGNGLTTTVIYEPQWMYGMKTLTTGTTANTDVTGRVTLASGAGTYTWTNGPVAGAYNSANQNCFARDITTPANAVTITTSATTLTFAGTGTDVVLYHCDNTN